MEETKLRKRIRKLRALAEQGVGGEAENARKRLDELLKYHGIELDEVEEQIRVWELTTLNEGSVLLNRVIKSIRPDANINVKQYKTRLIIEVVMSDIEYKEAVYKYKFVWHAYNRERQIFLSAFQNKNAHLFMPEVKHNKPAPTGDGAKPPPSMPSAPLSAGEVPMASEEQQRVGIIMSALKFWKYIKTSNMIEARNPDGRTR